MNDINHLIQEARSRLIVGLQTLQAPGVPREVSETSAPVAHAMGLLHRLEASAGEGLAEVCPVVLSTLQRALHQLQWTSHSHPSLERAADQVASALGLVFTLSAFASTRSATSRSGTEVLSGDPTSPSPSPDTRHGPQGAPPPKPTRADALAETADQLPASAEIGKSAALDSMGSARTDIAGLLQLDAALAANSTTNFYRGLGGDDVVEHGGLFVATYTLPEVGQNVAVKVAMPNGHEFVARGIVRWRRLVPLGASQAPDTPPGFGMAFTDLPNGARELIAHYVGYREPLFHDD